MDTNQGLSQDDYQALAAFRYQLRCFFRFSEQTARAAGLEPQQHQLLLVIRGMPGEKNPSIGELAERLQLQHHSTVELIDRTVERGFLERHRDAEDQRRVLILLTDQGRNALEKLSVLHRTELRTMGPALVQALQALLGASRAPRRRRMTHEHVSCAEHALRHMKRTNALVGCNVYLVLSSASTTAVGGITLAFLFRMGP